MAVKLDKRLVTMKAQWARTAQTDIPVPPVPGASYRNVALTAGEMEIGQAYDKVFDSSRYNEMLHQATGMALEAAKYGIPRYSELTDYAEGGFCLGLDGSLCQALMASGPGIGGVGPKPTTDARYWKPIPFDDLIDLLGKSASFLTAPGSDGKLYGMKDGSWSEIEEKEDTGGTGGTGGGTGGSTGKVPHLPVDGGGDFSGTGPGVWRGLVQTGSGVALPAGGVWAFFYIAYVSGGNNKYNDAFRQRIVGVLPGGTMVNTATGFDDYDFAFGFCWRVL